MKYFLYKKFYIQIIYVKKYISQRVIEKVQ